MSQLTFDAAAAKSLEAIYLTPDVIAQRARVLDLLAPQAGERVLDIGVGPGLLAYDLARLVGEGGRLVGLDLSPSMVAAAAERLAGLPQAQCRRADATDLGEPDGAFDAAVSTQVSGVLWLAATSTDLAGQIGRRGRFNAGGNSGAKFYAT